jgi:L-ascorbate metabolism protein UlaG (beta-lactamase superfamily)
MAEIRRLTDSCLLLTTDADITLFDPGFHTYTSGEVGLDDLGDVTRVLVTHEHGDHVSPDFLRWLIDRRSDLTVYSNQAVADLLAPHDIKVVTDAPEDVTVEDVLHEMVPSGDTPPNRAFTIDGLITHPGDSFQPTRTAPVLALPLMAPWGSSTGAVEFARRLGPAQVIPVHDFYLSESGRTWIQGMIKGVLAPDGIELVDLGWGEGYTV